jgi:general stress protein YciG
MGDLKEMVRDNIAEIGREGGEKCERGNAKQETERVG